MKAYWGSRGIVHAFLTSSLDEGGWSLDVAAAVPMGKEPLVLTA
jgi:hypothetical protein